MYSKSTSLFISLSIYYFIVATCFPAVLIIASIPAYTPAVMLIILTVLLINPRILVKNHFFFMILLAGVLTLIFYSGFYFFPNTIWHELFNSINMFFNAAILFELIVFTQNIKQIKRIVVFFIFLIFVKSLLGILVELVHPGIHRELSGLEESESLSFGVMTFGTIFALPFVTATFLFLAKYVSNNSLKFIYASLSLICLTASVTSSRVTGLLFSIFLFVVVLIMNVKSPKITRIFYIVFVIFGLIFVFQSQILSTLEKSNIPILQQKALSMQESVESKEATGDVYERTSRYDKSYQTFLQSPIFGSNSRQHTLGGHSLWLDFLGRYGLVGTLPILFILLSIYNRVKIVVPYQFNSIYFLLFITNLVILFFNPFADVDSFIWLFVFIPLLFYIVQLEEDESKVLIA